MGKGKKNRKRDTASDDASASTEAAGPTVQAAELKETNEEEGNVAMEAEEVRVGGSEAEASGSEAKKEKKEKEKKSKKREGESEMSAEQTEPEPNENVGGLAGEQPTTADNGDVEGEVGEQVKASEREREVIERENQARARVDTAAVERLSKGFTATLLPTLDALTHRLDECRCATRAQARKKREKESEKESEKEKGKREGGRISGASKWVGDMSHRRRTPPCKSERGSQRRARCAVYQWSEGAQDGERHTAGSERWSSAGEHGHSLFCHPKIELRLGSAENKGEDNLEKRRG